jgi:hypothetical protein
MTMKSVLAALMAMSLFAFAPAYAQDADEGTTVEEPMDPGTDDSGDSGSDASGDESGGE